MFGKDGMQPEKLITYKSLVQEAMHKSCSLIDSKWRKPANSKENPVNNTAEIVYPEIRHSVKDKDSGGGLSTNSVANFRNCGRKFHIQRY